MFENDTNPLISVIVPIYNVENYIRECVDSIINQSYRNIEVLLIDDGSTDESGTIIDSYKCDERILVFHKCNGGLSDARNYGIEKANGDYILFIDSDDFLCDDRCLEKISKVIDDCHPDVVQYKKVYWYEKDNIKYDVDLRTGLYLDMYELMSNLNKIGLLSVSSCDKAIKRDVIINKNLRFKKDLLSEDILFAYQLFLSIKNMYLLNENIYAYRQARLGSISTTKSKKNFDSLYYIVKYWYNYEYPNEEYKNLYFNMISYWYLIMRTDYPIYYYSAEQKDEFKSLDKFWLKYNENFKVNMAFKLSRVIGTKMMFLILRFYQKMKKKGLIRINHG